MRKERWKQVTVQLVSTWQDQDKFLLSFLYYHEITAIVIYSRRSTNTCSFPEPKVYARCACVKQITPGQTHRLEGKWHLSLPRTLMKSGIILKHWQGKPWDERRNFVQTNMGFSACQALSVSLLEIHFCCKATALEWNKLWRHDQHMTLQVRWRHQEVSHASSEAATISCCLWLGTYSSLSGVRWQQYLHAAWISQQNERKNKKQKKQKNKKTKKQKKTRTLVSPEDYLSQCIQPLSVDVCGQDQVHPRWPVHCWTKGAHEFGRQPLHHLHRWHFNYTYWRFWYPHQN